MWGPGRVGVHIAPRGGVHSISDSDPAATFGHVAEELGRRKIAFVCGREKVGPDSLSPRLKRLFGGVYIANEGFERDSAKAVLDAGWADAVAFGKAFLANPDLPDRLRADAPLNAPRPETFYGGGAEGYTDYPVFEWVG